MAMLIVNANDIGNDNPKKNITIIRIGVGISITKW